MSITLQILDNILLLSFLGLSYFFVERQRDTLGPMATNVLNGLCFGLIAFLVTGTPVTMSDGATVDARAGPVILAGVVGGPVGATLAALLGMLSRGLVGGSFAVSGMVVYAVYAVIGMALWYLRVIRADTIAKPMSILILAALACCGAAAMFFVIQPMERAVSWAQLDLPYILLANTLSVGFAAIILGVATMFLKKTAEVTELNERLNLARRAGGFGIWDFDIRSGKLKWD